MGAACIRDPSLEDGIGAVDYSDCSSEVSDSERDLSSSAGNFVALDAPGFLKRTCGVGAFEYDSSLERRHKATKLDERLDGLRAVLPEGHTLSKERSTIVLDAYHYITTLKRQVEDLEAELLDDASSNSAHTRPEELFCEGQRRSISYHSGEPVVNVAKQNGLLEVSIVCANRPGLLVEIMEAIESAGLTIIYTRIACHNEIMVEHLSLEMNEDTQEGEGEERVKTMFLRAISQGPAGSHLQ